MQLVDRLGLLRSCYAAAKQTIPDGIEAAAAAALAALHGVTMSDGAMSSWQGCNPGEAARLTAMQGAEVLVYPTAIGWHPEEKAKYGERQHAAWETIQRGHAIANGCFVIAVNRTGFEPDPRGTGGIEFWGQSFIAAPDGRVVARAPQDREVVLVEEIDLAEIDSSRAGWPFFRDRRIDAYGDIVRRFIDDA